MQSLCAGIYQSCYECMYDQQISQKWVQHGNNPNLLGQDHRCYYNIETYDISYDSGRMRIVCAQHYAGVPTTNSLKLYIALLHMVVL
jgi:hypothetical protein